jgi:sugar lactone lactonase YvrE
MSAPEASETRMQTLLTGLGFGESPRWHQDRLWFANWGSQQIVAVDGSGNSEVIVRVPTTIPYGFDWLPDGSLLIVSGPEGLVLRMQPDRSSQSRSLVTHADLNGISSGGWNEIVVDGRGNAYVNGGGIALVRSDGTVRQVADSFAFPNGMAVTPDNSTLIIAESHGKRLTAFEIERDGNLKNRRVWADLGDGVPDGICVDAENAVWYADVPNRRCVRVREGGEVLQTIQLDRGCFACMLGAADRKTLFMVAAEWLGFAKIAEALAAQTGQVLTANVSVPGAGWPWWDGTKLGK